MQQSQTDRPGFSFIICPDPGLAVGRIQELLASRPEAWVRRTFWADEPLPSVFWEDLSLQNLFAEKKALVVRRAESLLAEDWDKFLPWLSRRLPHAWPIFCIESAWSKDKPPISTTLSSRKFWQLAQERKWVWSSPGIRPEDIPARINQWAKKHGFSFESGALQDLAKAVPAEAVAIDQELEKLRLLLGDRRSIARSDLSQVFSQPSWDIFAFFKELERADAPVRVWRMIRQGETASDSELLFPFSALLLREARILWQLAAGDDQNVSLPPSIKSTKVNLARKLGLATIGRIFDLVLDAEQGVKTGRLDPEQALNWLVTELLGLFQTKRS